MTDELAIDLNGRSRFAPGERLDVAVAWELSKPPKRLTLELVWRTQGRGRTDARAAHRVIWEGGLAAAGAQVVPWVMPAGPWTHEGKLVSVGWAFRLVDGSRIEEAGITLRPPEPAG